MKVARVSREADISDFAYVSDMLLTFITKKTGQKYGPNLLRQILIQLGPRLVQPPNYRFFMIILPCLSLIET